MPRSRSRSIESSTCDCICFADSVAVASRSRSASVDLPWSMWAMMQKLRMCCGFMASTRSPGLEGLGMQAQGATLDRAEAPLEVQRRAGIEVEEVGVAERLQAA